MPINNYIVHTIQPISKDLLGDNTRRKCKICGRDIGPDAPGMTCWTCFKKINDTVEVEVINDHRFPSYSSGIDVEIHNDIAIKEIELALKRTKNEKTTQPTHNINKLNNGNKPESLKINEKTARSTYPHNSVNSIQKNNIESLINDFNSFSSTERNKAVDSLVKIGKPAFQPVLNASFRDVNVIRRKACDFFGLLGDPDGVVPLIRLLKDQNNYVRRRAANALIRIGDERAVLPLIRALNDPEVKVRSRAAEALGNIGDPKALDALRSAAQDSIIKYSVNTAMNKIKTAEEQKKLDAQLNQAKTKAKLGSYECLIEMLDSKNRYNAKKELIKIGEPAVPSLIEKLETSDKNNEQIAFTLSEINSSQAIEPLTNYFMAVLVSESESRHQAKDELVRIGEPAVEPLIGALNHQNIIVISLAADALGQIGNPEALDVLEKALNDIKKGEVSQRSKNVCNTVFRAIDKLKRTKEKSTFKEAKIDAKKGSYGGIIDFLVLGSRYRERAKEELIKIGEPAVSSLIRKLETSESNEQIAFTLLEINSPRAIEPLTNALIEILVSDSQNRYKAQKGLIKIGEPAVNQLLYLLNHSDPSVYQSAEKALLSIGNEKSLLIVEKIRNKREIDSLIKELIFQKENVPFNTVNKLVSIGEPAVLPLIKTLNNSFDYVSIGVIITLGKIGDDRATKPLLNLIKKHGIFMEETKAAFVQIGKPSVKPLIGALENSYKTDPVDETFQNYIARALCEIGDASSIKPLIDLLKSSKNGDLQYNKYVADSMYLLGEPVVKPLINALKDPNLALSLSAANALRHIKDPSAVPTIIEVMENPNTKFREEYALTLAAIGNSAAINSLVKALDDTDRKYASNIAKLLVEIGKPTISPIIEAIENSKGNQCLHTVLIGIGEPAFENICELLNDQDWKIRNKALQDIIEINSSKAFWYVITALNDENEIIRMNAANKLGKMADQRAVNHLMDALKDQSVKVRNAAAEALNNIEQPKQVPKIKQFTERELQIQSPPKSPKKLQKLPFNPPKAIIYSGKHNFYEEGKIHQTIRGERVRSKSEVIIADQLHLLGFNYEYEGVLEFNSEIRRPDFIIRNSASGKIYYWEHLGMLKVDEYRKNWEHKKEWYRQNGITEEGGPNGTLIITQDDADGGISSKEVNEKIKKIKRQFG